MINFRFHIISLIAVFLALGIGVIMGTAVIDRAVVDRLERQQSSLRRDIDDVRSTNRDLENALNDERDAAAQLAEEGSQRLLSGTLDGTPVLLVATRGAEADGLDDLVTLVGRANAESRGTLWFTERFLLAADEDLRDLAQALGSSDGQSAGALRAAAVERISSALRPVTGAGSIEQEGVLSALREAGFLEYDPPPGGDADQLPVLDRDTRFLLFSGVKAQVPDRQLMLPFVRALVAARDDREAVGVLAVGGQPPEESEDDTFVGPIRNDDVLRDRLSTVDDIDDFSGRLATVLALVDLGVGRTGHFGRGSGAQSLLPAAAS